MPPDHFMPIAERSNIINDVGGWILHHACMEAGTWPGEISVALTFRCAICKAAGSSASFWRRSPLGLPPERLESNSPRPC